MWRSIIVMSLLFCSGTVVRGAEGDAKPKEPAAGIEAKTSGLQHVRGFLPLHWDAKNGKLYLEIPHWGADFLYLTSLPYGLGSNDLGLDRGQMDEPRLVRFERFGSKVLLVQPNQSFRSSAGETAERLAVRQSFPESVLAGFKIEAEGGGAVLVDATDFFLRDAHEVLAVLTANKQGSYKLDPQRSAILMENTRAFPRTPRWRRCSPT